MELHKVTVAHVQRISSAFARSDLGKSGSRPENSLVDFDILGSQQRHAISCTGGNHTFISVTCTALSLSFLS